MDLDIRDFPKIKAKSEMSEIYFICNRSKREMQDSALSVIFAVVPREPPHL